MTVQSQATPSTPTGWARVPWDADARRGWREIPFSIDEYEARITTLRQLVEKLGLNGCIVHGNGNDVANILYYAAWSNPYGGHALLVVPAHGRSPALLTSSIVHGEPMHTEIYATWSDDVRCTPVRENARPYAGAPTLEDMLIDVVHETGMDTGRLGFVGRFGGAFRDLIRERTNGIRELAASGPRSGFRNVRPTSRRLEQGDFIYIGMGLRHRGYCGRISTGNTIGAPSPSQLAFLDANVEIVEKALAVATPGVRAVELVRVAEAVGAELGVTRDQWPGGHGLGIHTHEPPFINPESDDTIEVGMTFVFEPMLIRTGFGTANAERVYLMTPDGARSLSDVPLTVW